MPHPDGRTKASGDVHAPDGEERARRNREGGPVADDSDRPLDEALQDEARPGKGENQAGFLKDKEAPGPGEGSRSR